MFQSIYEDIEIKFWQVVIPWMQNSAPVQKVVNIGFATVRTYLPLPTFVKATIWITVGWALGMALGMASTLLA